MGVSTEIIGEQIFLSLLKRTKLLSLIPVNNLQITPARHLVQLLSFVTFLYFVYFVLSFVFHVGPSMCHHRLEWKWNVWESHGFISPIPLAFFVLVSLEVHRAIVTTFAVFFWGGYSEGFNIMMDYLQKVKTKPHIKICGLGIPLYQSNGREIVWQLTFKS